MLYRNNKAVYDIFLQHKNIERVYYGLQIVWEWIKSCFGKGYWINDNIWLNEDSWKNTND